MKSDLTSEGEDDLEARWALRRQDEDLDEASKPTMRAVANEGGGANQAPERSHTHF